MPTLAHALHTFEASNVRSLVWSGDELVDWTHGGRRYSLAGDVLDLGDAGPNEYDGACATKDGTWIAVYQTLGTKGRLLHNGESLRELTRAAYHASDYAYPICLWRERVSGKVLLAHCPTHYNQIEIEEAATGRRLTASEKRQPIDFFHAGLQVSPNGKQLLSAGWAWHPWDIVVHFDLARALTEPTHLDNLDGRAPHSGHIGLAEESTACWLSDTQLVIGASDEPEEKEEVDEIDDDRPRLRPNGFAIYDIERKQIIASHVLALQPGMMMPVGTTHVVAFFEYPRLVSLTTGEVECAWPQLSTNRRASSISHYINRHVAFAFDSQRRRFAVAADGAISVVTLSV